jgi:hypothetical protein
MKPMMMLGAVALVSTMAYAAPAQPPPGTQPTYEPLIAHLGDDNPHLRDAAVRDLRKAGREALPALRDAAKSSNPQVRDSAEMLVAEAEGKRTPRLAAARQQTALSPADALELQALAMPQGRIVVRGGNLVLNNVRLNNMPGQMQLQVVRNGQFTRDLTINENGRKIQIHEDNNGIKLQVGEGAEAKEYTAKNADELKEKEPEAFKLYEKYVQNAAGRLNIRVEPPMLR